MWKYLFFKRKTYKHALAVSPFYIPKCYKTILFLKIFIYFFVVANVHHEKYVIFLVCYFYILSALSTHTHTHAYVGLTRFAGAMYMWYALVFVCEMYACVRACEKENHRSICARISTLDADADARGIGSFAWYLFLQRNLL